MSVRSLLAVAVVGLVMSVSAEAAGDAARGKTLGYTCLGCHGIENYKNVYPTFAVPRLRGQQQEYLVAALKEYKKGDRSHGTMHAHASTLSDQDMEDVAAYLAGEPAKPVAGAKPVGKAPAVAQQCQACHGTNGEGAKGLGPIISGQHADYLEHALQGYKSGARKNALMATVIPNLKPEDYEALAEYFAHQQPLLKTVPKKEKLAAK
jgi:cytochrome c553